MCECDKLDLTIECLVLQPDLYPEKFFSLVQLPLITKEKLELTTL